MDYPKINARYYASSGDLRTVMAVLYLLGEDLSDPAIEQALEPMGAMSQRRAISAALGVAERADRARVLAAYLAGLIHAIDEWSLA